jgi:DnaK suppressor protein
MEQNQLDVFRKALISLRDEIEQLNTDSRDAADTVTLDQSKVGRLSRMDAMQAQQMAQETARRRQLQLQKIDNALRRMDAGDYGYCFKCGDDIDAARLNFDPASTRCMECMDD